MTGQDANDRFGLRRSSIATASGVFRSWTDNRGLAAAQRASAIERRLHSTIRGRSDDSAGLWADEPGVPTVRTSRHPVWLRAPDDVRMELWSPETDRLEVVTISTATGRYHWGVFPHGPHRLFTEWSDDPGAWNPRRIDPLGDPATNALIYPGWRSLGLTEVDRRPTDTLLGRAGTEVDYVRTVPWSDPESMGMDDWPYDIEDADLIRMVEDAATGAVVQWEERHQGQVFRRHWWSELELDVELDPMLFDPDIQPPLAPWVGPFVSTVVEPPPRDPPIVELAATDDPRVRQGGLHVGGSWGTDALADEARAGHPVPLSVGPFGQEVTLRIFDSTPPQVGTVFLHDSERTYIPVVINLFRDDITSEMPAAGTFRRVGDGTVVARFSLPPWTDRLHLLVHLNWRSSGPAMVGQGGLEFRASYAFTLATDRSST